MAARYTLYIGSKNISSWSLRSWLAMKTAKLAFGEVLIPLRKPKTGSQIKALSPSAKVPVLKIEEGGLSRTVWDSLAICETLAERHPEAHLWPEDSTARAEARSIVAEMHSGFPDLRRVLPMDLAARYPTPPLDDAVQMQIARIVEIVAIGAGPLWKKQRLSVRAFHDRRCVLCAGGDAFRNLRRSSSGGGASLYAAHPCNARHARMGRERRRPKRRLRATLAFRICGPACSPEARPSGPALGSRPR